MTVKSIVAPSCGHGAGDGDIAVLVLERAVHGVKTRAPELDQAPLEGVEVMPIGFGRCAQSGDGVYRKVRNGTAVTRVAPEHFQLQAAICPGDSGGPALLNGYVVAVASYVYTANCRYLDGYQRADIKVVQDWLATFGIVAAEA